ncbi:uncharacterized protein LOC142239489 [Haematobia irritans]|uniref:uncharacterized protein LOC142239489 n=1 Tax=Haematobia irritans TaxID=7368 RepID=UPI003F4FB03D
MLSKLVYLLLFVFSFLNSIQATKRLASLEVESFVCKNNTDIVKRYYCNLRTLDLNTYGIDGNLELYRDAPKTMEMTAKVHIKRPGSDKVITFLNLKMPVCDVLSTTMGIPLARDVISELRKAGNFPYSCPIKGNVLFIVKNMTLSTNILPTYTPPFIKFNVTLDFEDNENHMGQMKLQGSTVSG